MEAGVSDEGRGRKPRPASALLPWRPVVAVFAAGLGINLLLLAVPLYSLQVFDRVLATRSVETLALLSAGVLIALGAMALIDALRARLLLRLGNRYSLALEPQLVQAGIARAALGGGPGAGALRDLAAVRGFLTAPHALVALLDAPLAPFFVAFVYFIHPTLGHTTVAGAVALLALALAAELLTAGPQKQATESSHEAQSRIDAMLRNAESVEAMGMRTAMLERWQDAQHRNLAFASRVGDALAVLLAAARFVRFGLGIAITGIGALLAVRGDITAGALIAASILSVRGFAPLELLIGAWRQLVKARAALARMDRLLAGHGRPPEAMRLPAPRGELHVDDLTYVPPGADQPALRGVTFRLPAGTIAGLVGPSGAGKTTLLRLLCGLVPARTGAVRLDGADVRAWDRGELGRHIGYLPQGVQLLEGTVRQNIARFGAASDVEVIEAARLAGAHEMILRLPQGYQTPVGPDGAALSGGQRQRVALARALLGRPALVLLDEPNAALDADGEAGLVRTLAALKRHGSTVVIASHRPLIVGCADAIAVMMNGRLERIGEADDILRALIRPAARTKLIQEAAGAGA